MNLKRIPEHMRASVRAYVEGGKPPGGFLLAVLSDRFMAAIMCADETNLASIAEWAAFVWNELPGNVWGSPDKVDAWIEKKRLERNTACSSQA